MISGDLYLKKVHANWWAWKKVKSINIRVWPDSIINV
jgi:hypothetical protein